MKNLLLDTNTLNFLLRKRQPVVDHLVRARREEAHFLLASVVHYELTRYLELKGSARLIRLYQELVESWTRCHLTFEDWDSAALLWAERHRRGKTISDLDLLLATLARKHEAVVVTANTRHFEDLGVAIEDWTLPLAP